MSIRNAFRIVSAITTAEASRARCELNAMPMPSRATPRASRAIEWDVLLGAAGDAATQYRALIEPADFKRHIAQRENERARRDGIGIAGAPPARHRIGQ